MKDEMIPLRRLFAIAQDEYRRTLDKHGVLDFPDLLERTLKLLGQMEEFSRSRYRLESRYEHVLVDEFQDTSRAQWELVAQLVKSWGEGLGASADALPSSIFIVGVLALIGLIVVILIVVAVVHE